MDYEKIKVALELIDLYAEKNHQNCSLTLHYNIPNAGWTCIELVTNIQQHFCDLEELINHLWELINE